jgi:hypothetical protein
MAEIRHPGSRHGSPVKEIGSDNKASPNPQPGPPVFDPAIVTVVRRNETEIRLT